MNSDEKKDGSASKTGKGDSGNSAAVGGVAEFLQSPKKKQRNYIVLATGSNLSGEVKDEVVKYLQSLSKAFVLVQPRNAEELARQISRSIHLLVLDDSFAERVKLLKLVRFMKEKLTSSGMPVMFLTRDPAGLTAVYRRELMAHQEMDDFIALKGLSAVEVVARVKQAIETRNRRRSRRFNVAMPISYQLLGNSQLAECQLIDISLHGAQIAGAPAGSVFKVKSQIRIEIPVAATIGSAEGEILRLSARVRRVSVDGDRAGVSFEHLNDRHVLALTKLVTALAAEQSTSRKVDNTAASSSDS